MQQRILFHYIFVLHCISYICTKYIMTSATAAAADDDDNEDSDNSDTDITDINCKIIETINKKTKKIHMHTKAVGLFKAGFPHK